MNKNPVFSCVEYIQDSSDRFFAISDVLHRRLTVGGFHQEATSVSLEIYGVLVDEYGLRARASILRNDAIYHVVENATRDQKSLLTTLDNAAVALERVHDLHELRSIVVSISTLCVAISPGKGAVVDFLIDQLQGEIYNCEKNY